MNKPVNAYSYEEEAIKESIRSRKRNLFFVVFIILGMALGCLPLINQSRYLPLAQLLGFLGLGVAYVLFFHDRYLLDEQLVLMYTLLLVSGLLVLLFAVYFITAQPSLLIVVYFCSALLVPVVLKQAWLTFKQLSIRQEKNAWMYSKELAAIPDLNYLQSQPLRFKLLAPQSGGTTIASTVPLSLEIGSVFYSVVEREASLQTETLLMDKDQKPYEWLFYIPYWGIWKKYLDPDASFSDYHLKPNTMIVAERIN